MPEKNLPLETPSLPLLNSEKKTLVGKHASFFFQNTVGKGEIACNKQFLLFPQCLFTHLYNFVPFSSKSELSLANSFSFNESKFVVWERVKVSSGSESNANEMSDCSNIFLFKHYFKRPFHQDC